MSATEVLIDTYTKRTDQVPEDGRLGESIHTLLAWIRTTSIKRLRAPLPRI